MSGIRLTKVDEATIVTPPAGKVTIFANDADGEPSYKDESGTVTSLQGVAGPTGATGAGVPVAGTAGQLLAKIDGTDYNTEWVDAGAPVLHASSHENGGSDEINVGGLSGTLADPQPTAISQITDASAYAKTLLDDADAATARTTLGLAIGTNVQAYDAELAALAGLTSAADKGIQFTGSGTAATYDLTTAGKALLDDANAAAQLVTLGAASAADLATEVTDRGTADTALDSRLDALEAATTPPEAQGTWLASGGAVVFLQNYDFRVSAAVYYINGTQYSAAQTDLTLDAADGTFDRFDAIAVTTSGTVVKITGTAAANPALPDIDPETQLALTYVLVQASSSAPAITLTNIYLENTEWTSSVSGGTINAASTSNPFAGTKDIEATASAAGHYVRLTNGSPISLADKKQLVLNIRSKASWPNPKSLQITWYLSGVKIGQSAALSSGKFGFVSATTGAYQQIVIPMSAFAVPSSSTVDRLEFLVSGSGGTIGFYLDNIVLESGSASVTPPSVGAATASTLGLVRTDVTDANPQVYLKASVDTLLALKAPLASPTFTGTPAVPDDAYDATTWNGSTGIPTKNAIRDKIEAVIAGGGYTDEQAQDAVGAMVDASLTYVDGTPLLQRAALTGDVTASAGSNSTTIANDAVTYAKMQNVSAASKLLGRGDSGSGDPQEITVGTGLSISGTTLSATSSSLDEMQVQLLAQFYGA